jgi:acetyl esterase/lipase
MWESALSRPSTTGNRWKRVLWTASLALLLMLLATVVAFKVSPWPSALVIRSVFERGGAQTNAALAVHVPAGIESREGLQYDPDDPAAMFDLHRPAALQGKPLPVIVWIHGGGFIAGSRAELANYARILAAEGYAVAVVDYSLAPGSRYPVPVRQVNRALAHLSDNAQALGLDRSRFILGGDSAGAQLASQLAVLTTSPVYVKAMELNPGLAGDQLRGVVLFCGPHDARLMASQASSSWFLRTVMWSYLGRTDPPANLLQQFSVVPNVTAAFPPAFITVGNADPLASQSYALAKALQLHGVRAETLFFPAAHTPALGHEYQFDLSRPEARQALERTRAFLRSLDGTANTTEASPSPAGS